MCFRQRSPSTRPATARTGTSSRSARAPNGGARDWGRPAWRRPGCRAISRLGRSRTSNSTQSEDSRSSASRASTGPALIGMVRQPAVRRAADPTQHHEPAAPPCPSQHAPTPAERVQQHAPHHHDPKQLPQDVRRWIGSIKASKLSGTRMKVLALFSRDRMRMHFGGDFSIPSSQSSR